MPCDNKWNNSINKNTISIFPHFHKNRNVILPPLCAADVHLPKDDEIIIVCTCVRTHMRAYAWVCVHARACVCCYPIWIPGRTRAQASLLQFTSITSYNPISHSIDPQNCCSPEPAANTGISPHHFTTIVLYYTKKPPFVSEQTQPCWNMNYKCMANKKEGGKRERDGERDSDREKWLVETSEKMTPLQESIDQFLSKGDVRHEITWQFEH